MTWSQVDRGGSTRTVATFDGRDDFTRETDLLAHALTQHKPGERVPVKILRDGKPIEVTLPMQP